MKESNRWFGIPYTPDFLSHNEACDFYRDHCDTTYYRMDIYESISVHKCFVVEDEFVLLLKATPKKAEFTPRPFEEETKQTIANSRESAEAARNKVESTPRTL